MASGEYFFVFTICLTGGANYINNKILKYEWDREKNAANKAKHGIGFEEAATFEWDTAFVTRDLRADYGEPRFTALGFIEARLCVMIFTKRGDVVRIISLRKANARERRFYEEA